MISIFLVPYYENLLTEYGGLYAQRMNVRKWTDTDDFINFNTVL
jgi:hypothetical protein